MRLTKNSAKNNKKIISRVDIKIGFSCNNLCKFCIQGDKRNFIAAKPEKEIRNNLKQSFKEGISQVVFTGGEPTLHPRFLDLVEFAQKIGYKNIQIQTNGRRFAYLDFCKETINAGVNEFALSIHGHNAKIHDFLTSSPGSFNQVVQAVKNLKALNQRVITNTVITTVNYKYLPKIAKLLVDLNINQLQLAFIHISDAILKNKKWIIPRKKQVAPYVKKGLDVGIEAGISVMTEAIPPCLLKEYEKYISDLVIPYSKVYDAGFIMKDFTDYRINITKARGPNCPKCVYFSICEGPWKEYPELFGWKEFKPVMKKHV